MGLNAVIALCESNIIEPGFYTALQTHRQPKLYQQNKNSFQI